MICNFSPVRLMAIGVVVGATEWRGRKKLWNCSNEGKRAGAGSDWNLAASSDTVHRDELSPKRPFAVLLLTTLFRSNPAKRKTELSKRNAGARSRVKVRFASTFDQYFAIQ